MKLFKFAPLGFFLNTRTAVWDGNAHKKQQSPTISLRTHGRLPHTRVPSHCPDWLSPSGGIKPKTKKKWKDYSRKSSNSLVSEKNMAASAQYVTLPEPALSDLCPDVLLFTTFGSNLDWTKSRLSLKTNKKIINQQIMLLFSHKKQHIIAPHEKEI